MKFHLQEFHKDSTIFIFSFLLFLLPLPKTEMYRRPEIRYWAAALLDAEREYYYYNHKTSYKILTATVKNIGDINS